MYSYRIHFYFMYTYEIRLNFMYANEITLNFMHVYEKCFMQALTLLSYGYSARIPHSGSE